MSQVETSDINWPADCSDNSMIRGDLMNSLSLTKFMAFVITLFMFSLTAMGQAASQIQVQPSLANGEYLAAEKERQALERERDRRSERKACLAAQSKYNSEMQEAMSKCKGTGKDLTSCSKSIQSCDDTFEEELPIFPSIGGLDINQFGLTGGFEDKCKDLTYKEHRDEKKDLEREKKEIEKDLEKKEKEILEDEEKYQDASNSLQEKIQELIDEKDKVELEDQENERNLKSQEKDSIDAIKAKIREIEGKILAAERLKIETAHLRTQRANIYKDLVIDCKFEAEKLLAERRVRPRSSGNLASAAGRAGGDAALIQTKYQNCVQKVLDQRTSEQIRYQGDLEKLDRSIENSNQELAELKESERLLIAQAAQAEADRQAAKEKRAQSYLDKYKALYEQRVAQDNLMTQRRNKNQQAFNRAKIEANKTSNELTVHERAKPVKDIGTSVSKAIAARSDCESTCSDFPEEAKKCGGGSGSKSGSNSSARGSK